MFTFYDVVMDFILMDAFDDLARPPSSVVAVAQNRFLSASFKESVSSFERLYYFLIVKLLCFADTGNSRLVSAKSKTSTSAGSYHFYQCYCEHA